ncbi:glutamate-cysteine ligase family protein [Luedemannella flava]
MESRSGLTRDELTRYFSGSQSGSARVGIEVECGVVDRQTGLSAAYHGELGTRRLLECISSELAGTPYVDEGHLMGVALPTGARFSLELGGALEYSSAAFSSLGALIPSAVRDIGHAARVADRIGLALLATGMLPVTPVDRIPWIPKARVEIMRNYFRELGIAGSLAESVMGLTLSIQTTLDYFSEEDLASKLSLLVLASPILAAAFVNSPFEAGAVTGVLSRRLHCWQRVDPARCGVLPFGVRSAAPGGDLVDWALQLPMIYRVHAGRTTTVPPWRSPRSCSTASTMAPVPTCLTGSAIFASLATRPGSKDA